ncbi:hypothetical protein G9A89_018732 [Geosiphon pyriformis]|nr:hypothetical protein G9A89_018732 [Geosiphon pyriformis]
MAYAPIAKIEKFTGKEDDIQEETEAVTTYLKHFHKNLCQIQAIQANYFTTPQILNQFICGLYTTLQNAVTQTRDFKSTELEANHTQAINLVMNRSSDLNSKLKQLSNSINQKLEEYLVSSSELTPKLRPILTSLHPNNTTANLSTICILSSNLSANNTHHLSTTVSTYLLATASNNILTPTNSNITILQLNHQDHANEVQKPEDATSKNLEIHQTQPLTTNNILPATIIEDESFAAIFPFESKELSETSLFNEVTLEEKFITVMYTDAKINGHSIKLILDSGLADTTSAKIITANRATKTPIGKIDDLFIKVNSIIVPIKVLVMKATQYQVLIGNDWLSKTNMMFD